MSNCERTSIKEPKAIFKKCTWSLLEVRDIPSAIFEVTDTDERRNCEHIANRSSSGNFFKRAYTLTTKFRASIYTFNSLKLDISSDFQLSTLDFQQKPYHNLWAIDLGWDGLVITFLCEFEACTLADLDILGLIRMARPTFAFLEDDV